MFRTFMLHAYICVSLMIVTVSAAFGQNYGNGHPFDSKRFNLGFLMGLTYNSYNLKEQIAVEESGVLLNRIELLPKVGINFGMISNLKLTKQISLRSVVTISLEQRDFNYFFHRDSTVVRKIEAAYLNVPVLLQIKTKYYRATRFYVLTGPQWGINLSSNKKVRDDPNLLKIRQTDLSWSFGFGWNIYGDKIKLSPELLYTVGLFNIYEPQFTSHATAIGNLTSQVLSFNINFE